MTDGAVRLGVDVGGTFTDVVLVVDGDVTTAKVPTTPADQSEGVVAGIEAACEDAGILPDDVEQFRHATTVATNALLEREGAEVALVTTEGFADVLEIGRQDRPELYDPSAQKPDPLVPPDRRYELDERATTEGIEREPDEAAVRDLAEHLQAAPVDSVAVSFLHAYAHEDTEANVAETLRGSLDVPVAASHEVLPTFREYERTATTVADAFVTPVVGSYLDRLGERVMDLGLPGPRIVQSDGGIADADSERARGVSAALSGPAAGVVGASLFEPDGSRGVISFDMGGTSCDVGLVRDGDVERTTTGDVGDHPVRIPMVDVETVGAGGGSIARVDAGGALRVGPESAGAEPGPACYGRGGDRPTVTDAALVLGYLGPETALGGSLSLDADAATETLARLADRADLADARAAARGVYRVANARMTRAIRTVTVERGHDPRDLAIVAFGGAGPMHAAAVADRLGVETVLIPPANGVLSALGLLAADDRSERVRTHRGRLADLDPETLADRFETLEDAVTTDVAGDAGDATPALSRAVDARYAGQSHELTVPADGPLDLEALADRFHEVHERARGYRLADDPIELVNLRARATAPGDSPAIDHAGTDTEPTRRREATFDERRETRVYDRAALPVDASVAGPGIVAGGESTVVVPPGWQATVDERGTLVLEVTE